MAIALVVVPGPVAPAVIEVSGDCDLAEAIENANADSAVNGDCAPGDGADEIRLTADVVLTAVDNSTDGDNGLPSITSDVTIVGAENSISRDGAAADFRILHVALDGALTLDRTSVVGGRISGESGAGGGIFNRGELVLTSSTVSGGEVVTTLNAYGGGIYNLGTLDLSFSTVSDNTLTSDNYAFGGGIFNDFNCPATISNSSITSNTASADYAGGVGIESFYVLQLIDSVVSGNTGISTGGAYPSVLGVGIEAMGALSLAGTTVSDNHGSASGLRQLLFGGGIKAGSTVTLSNSTISGNSLSTDSLVGVAYGAGLHQAGTGVASHTTFSGNSTSGPVPSYHGGAAIFVSAGVPNGTISLVSSILADSTGGHCDGFGSINDIAQNQADDDTCVTVPDTLTGVDLVLLDNGGPTPTHALLVGSSAIGSAGESCIVTDQRGVDRDDGACDAGSFEFLECAAPDGPIVNIVNQGFTSLETFEVCRTIVLGPNVVVWGPDGHLSLIAGRNVNFFDGFEVQVDGTLTVELDPDLNL